MDTPPYKILNKNIVLIISKICAKFYSHYLVFLMNYYIPLIQLIH
jgi:hypothetical protein